MKHKEKLHDHTEHRCDCDHGHCHHDGHHDEHHHHHHDHHHHHHDHDHHCDHGHDHGECGCCCEEGIERVGRLKIFLYIIGAVALVCAFLPWLPDALRWVCAGAVYLTFGFTVWREMIEGIGHGKLFTEFTLMCIASVGALVLLEYADAAAVMYLYSLGETVSGLAGGRARRNIAELISIAPEQVTVMREHRPIVCSVSEVRVGETILVRAGERIPLDGIVFSGAGMADTSSVTGEQMPAELTVGTVCLSGSMLISGSVEIEVTHDHHNSVVTQMKAAVEEASRRKAVREKRIRRLAAVITPAAFVIALLVFAFGALVTGDVTEWFRRGLTILVCSCPCSLILSVPLTYFAGIGSAAGQGIVFRGGEVVDGVADIKTILFDKTGTLTETSLRFDGIVPAADAAMDEAEIMRIAYSVLIHSPHAAADTFCRETGAGVKSLDVTEVENIPGRGICGRLSGETVLAGNAAMMEDAGITVPVATGTVIHLAYAGKHLASLMFSSYIKENAVQAIATLREYGVERMALLSGDHETAVREVAQAVGLEEYYAEKMPAEKLGIFEAVYREQKDRLGGTVAFCGDGLNDSAVIAASDVGIAMGRGGSAVTVEAADLVLMDDSPEKIALAMRLARRTVRIVEQNILISLGLKIGIAIVCIAVLPSMELALIADVGAAVITVLNAMRAGKKQI